MSSRTEQRKSTFKKTVDADEARKKRAETSVNIRKASRDESLAKKRREGMALGAQGADQLTPSSDPAQHNEIAYFVTLAASADAAQQLEGVAGIRKKLSIERNPPINDVIRSGIVPKLIQYLAAFDQPKLQFEAAWALTNIASGDSTQTRFVVESGCVQPFVHLLASPNDDVREQAIWAIGNIAGDGAEFRDMLLQCNVVQALLTVIVPTAKITLIRNGTWTLSNLCRGKPAPKFELVRPALGLIGQLLASTDEEIVTDACWAASYLSDGPNEKIQAVVEAGLAPGLIQLLGHSSPLVMTPALRAVGNIVTGNEGQTQAVIALGGLAKMPALLGHQRKALRKEACWTLSNITAGNRAQIQSVIDAGLVAPVVALLEKGDFDVKREACWTVSNAMSGGAPAQIAHFVARGCVKPLCDVLVSSDTKIVIVALEALENILKTGAEASKTNENQYATLVEEADGIDKLEELQRHANAEIYSKAVALLEVYFGAEEEAGENDAPHNNNNTYAFGVRPTQASSNIGFSF